MRLQFESNGVKGLVAESEQVEVFNRITGRSAMAIESMKGGVPLQADGGEYTLVNDDGSPISIANFI